MNKSTRLAILILCASVLAATVVRAAYLDRTVHIVVASAPGGSSDFLSRLLAEKLSSRWGQPVVVDNKPGAGGILAEEFISHSSPDGYTIGVVTNAHTVIPQYKKVIYDPVKSFVAVTLISTQPDSILVINPTYVPVNSLKEFVAYAKSNPGKLFFGSHGEGSPNWLEMEVFMRRAGLELTNVSFTGAGTENAALLGGEVQTSFATLPNMQGLLKAGKLKVLGVGSSARVAELPDIPTIAEAAALPGFDEYSWQAAIVPAGTPSEVVQRIRDGIAELLKSSDVKRTLSEGNGYVLVGSTPQEAADFIKKDAAKWSNLFKTLKIKISS